MATEGGTFVSATGGTFETAMPGTFVSAAGGTFETVMPGTFHSATGGTFETVLGGTIKPLPSGNFVSTTGSLTTCDDSGASESEPEYTWVYRSVSSSPQSVRLTVCKDTTFHRRHQIFKAISSVMDEKNQADLRRGACWNLKILNRKKYRLFSRKYNHIPQHIQIFG